MNSIECYFLIPEQPNTAKRSVHHHNQYHNDQTTFYPSEHHTLFTTREIMPTHLRNRSVTSLARSYPVDSTVDVFAAAAAAVALVANAYLSIFAAIFDSRHLGQYRGTRAIR